MNCLLPLGLSDLHPWKEEKEEKKKEENGTPWIHWHIPIFTDAFSRETHPSLGLPVPVCALEQTLAAISACPGSSCSTTHTARSGSPHAVAETRSSAGPAQCAVHQAGRLARVGLCPYGHGSVAGLSAGRLSYRTPAGGQTGSSCVAASYRVALSAWARRSGWARSFALTHHHPKGSEKRVALNNFEIFKQVLKPEIIVL